MASVKNLETTIQEIASLEKKISAGDASLDEVIAFQSQIHSLYERATWLKFKAMEELQSASPEKNSDEKNEATAPSPETKEKEVEEERPTFNFTSAFSEPEQEVKQETIANTFSEKKEKPEQEIKEEKPEEKESQTSLLDAIGTDDQSINNALMEEEDNSLASKMQKTPIHDLNAAIGMNDRFSYINDLFEGQSETYNKALEQLNTLDNKVEAKEKLSDMAVEYSWDLENKVVQMFVELVERRYS